MGPGELQYHGPGKGLGARRGSRSDLGVRLGRLVILMTGFALLVMQPQPVHASEPDTPSDERMAELSKLSFAELLNVRVTSQRRGQPLREIPISVTVFGGDEISQNNIHESKDFLLHTPNTSFTEGGQAGSRGMDTSIRGVSNIVTGENPFQQAIGYYIDEQYIGAVANANFNPQLFDMERIEVLRGPQGTYFGRNNLAGAINATTIQPGPERVVELNAEAGSFATYGLSGVWNEPISEKLFTRGSLYWSKSDGVVDNIHPAGSDSHYRYLHARAAATWNVSQALKLDVSYTLSDEDEGMDPIVPTGTLDLDTRGIFGFGFNAREDGVGFYDHNTDRVNHNVDESNTNRVHIIRARAAWEPGAYRLKMIGGYVRSKHERLFDQDNISTDAILRSNDYTSESISLETRLESVAWKRFEWIIGAQFIQDTTRQFNSVFAGTEAASSGLLPPFVVAGFRINENHLKFRTRSYAVFGDATWRATERLHLSLGLRYTFDDVSARRNRTVAFEEPSPDASGSTDSSNVSPRVIAAYHWDFGTAYASFSTGYKAGGIQLNDTAETRPFDPEMLHSYEVGLKGRYWDGRLEANLAGFYTDWRDIQTETAFNFIDPETGAPTTLTTTANDARAQIFGAELEARLQPIAGVKLGLSVGYLHATFDRYRDAFIQGNSVDLSGKRLPQAPEWTLSANAQYDFSLTSKLAGFGRIEWTHRSKTTADLEGLMIASGIPVNVGDGTTAKVSRFPYQIPAFHVVNLRLGLTWGHFGAIGFVENLLDDDYYTDTQDNFGLSGIRVRPHPREFGIRLFASF